MRALEEALFFKTGKVRVEVEQAGAPACRRKNTPNPHFVLHHGTENAPSSGIILTF